MYVPASSDCNVVSLSLALGLSSVTRVWRIKAKHDKHNSQFLVCI